MVMSQTPSSPSSANAPSLSLWGGRFEKAVNPAVASFNASIGFDQRLVTFDILGSIAHARMLGRQNIIPAEEATLLVDTLVGMLADLEVDALSIDESLEDIHTWVESTLVARVGEVGKKLHTGRSRNDQVATDLRLYVRQEIQTLQGHLHQLQTVLVDLSEKHLETVMPGFTHLQPAQPITLAHHFMAYFEMFRRDQDRLTDCLKRVNVMPLGSGALAGTVYLLDRAWVAQELGFEGITQNSLDGVSDRDFCIELLSDLSLMMIHMSRLCEELILWASQAFQFVAMDDAYSTGSSMMPQKKNPDVAELIRGKSGRVVGSLMSLLTIMKSLPLAYNKDMQEDKEPLFDALDTTKACLENLTGMLATLHVNPPAMAQAAGEGFTNATDIADYLVERGVPFRDAHDVVGQLVRVCLEKSCKLEDLSLMEYRAISPVFDDTLYNAITLQTCINRRTVVGGPALDTIRQVLTEARSTLATFTAQLNDSNT